MKNLELTQSLPQARDARDGGRKREGVKAKMKIERLGLGLEENSIRRKKEEGVGDKERLGDNGMHKEDMQR